MIAVVVMVFSLLAGIGIAPQAAAKVTSELPKITGLYMADYVPTDWDQDQNKEVVRTDKDQNGNTVLIDRELNQVPYRDQEEPQYLSKGILEGWGMPVMPVQTLWFDYIDGKKVTHAPVSKLKVTHLDGSACNEVKLSTADVDSRVALIKATAPEPVLLTYTGAKKNNKMILMPDLGCSFYTTETATCEGYASEEINVVEGKKKDIYVHLSDSYWEDGRYKVDTATALSVNFWDDAKGENVELTGSAAAEYATLSVISDKDPHKMSYKVTLTGKKPVNNDYLNVNFDYREYNVNDGEESAYTNRCNTGVRVVKGDVLSMSYDDAFGIKN